MSMIQLEEIQARDVMTQDPQSLPGDCRLAAAVERLVAEGLHGVPVLDRGGALAGVLSVSDLLTALLPTLAAEPNEVRLREARERPVSELVEGRPPVSCELSLALTEVCKLMVRERVHRVLVLDAGSPVGVISAIDVVRAVACLDALNGRSPAALRCLEALPLELLGDVVARVMTTDLLTVAPDEPARRALTLMGDHGVRHLPVLDGDGLAGMLSNRDLIRVAGRSRRRAFDLDGVVVRDIMTPGPLYTTTALTPITDAAALMHRHKVSALPVLDGPLLVGIVTSDDLLSAMARGARAPLVSGV